MRSHSKAFGQAGSLVAIHGRHVTKRCRPGEGKCRIFANSSLRKLMRAARRGMIPDERMQIIQEAMQAAAKRAQP